VAWSPDGESVAISTGAATYFCSHSWPEIRSVPLPSKRVFFSRAGRLAALVHKRHVTVVDVRTCQVVARTTDIQFAEAADFSPDKEAVVTAGRDLSLYSWKSGHVRQLGTFGRNLLLFVVYDANGIIVAGGYPEYLIVTDGKGIIQNIPRGHRGSAVSRMLPTRSGMLLVTSAGILRSDAIRSDFPGPADRIRYYGSGYTDGLFEYACNAEGSLLAHADSAGVCVQDLEASQDANSRRELFVWPADWHRVSLRFDLDDRLYVVHVLNRRVELLGFAPIAARPHSHPIS
jgi:hypothetical protein